MYIFGSLAARYLGDPGETPHDIDVLVVGDKVSRLQVSAAAQRAEARLRIPVQTVVATNALDKAATLLPNLGLFTTA